MLSGYGIENTGVAVIGNRAKAYWNCVHVNDGKWNCVVVTWPMRIVSRVCHKNEIVCHVCECYRYRNASLTIRMTTLPLIRDRNCPRSATFIVKTFLLRESSALVFVLLRPLMHLWRTGHKDDWMWKTTARRKPDSREIDGDMFLLHKFIY